MVEVEFDPAKDAINRKKHGIGLLTGVAVLNNLHVRQRSTVPNNSNEERWVPIGVVQGRHVVCVYTMRGEVYRMISVRAARAQEKRVYEEAVARN